MPKMNKNISYYKGGVGDALAIWAADVDCSRAARARYYQNRFDNNMY